MSHFDSDPEAAAGMASQNERAEMRAVLIEVVDQRCLRNSHVALVWTGRWVVPKKEHKRSHFVHKLAGTDIQKHWTTAKRDFPFVLPNSPEVRMNRFIISDTLTNTTVSSVGLGPDL